MQYRMSSSFISLLTLIPYRYMNACSYSPCIISNRWSSHKIQLYTIKQPCAILMTYNSCMMTSAQHSCCHFFVVIVLVAIIIISSSPSPFLLSFLFLLTIMLLMLMIALLLLSSSLSSSPRPMLSCTPNSPQRQSSSAFKLSSLSLL
mmetsp:Transcript_22886/g.26487  ORF Transcript_22886/g.26487 Transcript_22886/m.26487 type:complete len:147 (-) Transcript_22886:40-480(-)